MGFEPAEGCSKNAICGTNWGQIRLLFFWHPKGWGVHWASLGNATFPECVVLNSTYGRSDHLAKTR